MLRLPVIPFGRVGRPEDHPRWDGEKILPYESATPVEGYAALGQSDALCPQSKRADKKHAWRFDGDDPYIVCVYCGARRDALSGRAA
jgi:hypothetical protein